MLRALEIHFGSPPLVEHVSSEKETTIALREIAQGKVTFKDSLPEENKTEEIIDVEAPDKDEVIESEIEIIVDEIEDDPKGLSCSND